MQFVGGAGTSTLVGGTGGTEQVTIGAGGIAFGAGTNNHSTITSGIGQATIFGGSGSVVNFVGNQLGGAIFVAGSGNETLNAAGSSTNNTFNSNSIASASQTFIGGTGNDTMIAGAGAATLTGGAGADAFAFFNQATQGKADVITDFDATKDSVYIIGYDSTKSASFLQNNATGPAIAGTGLGVTLTLSDSTTITFSNLSSASQLNGKILYG